MLFTEDVQYTGSIEHVQPSATSSSELPTCAVCLGILLNHVISIVLCSVASSS